MCPGPGRPAGAHGGHRGGGPAGACWRRSRPCNRRLRRGLDLAGGAGEGPARGAWRRYRLLVLRYVESLDVLDVCARLAISRREYERQHRLGLDAILSLLSQRWEVRAGPSPAPMARSAPAAASLPAGRGGLRPAGRAGAGPPRPLTSLIGREEEIAAVTRLLRRACLLTLTGPAGVSKTRLSLEVATRLGEDYADGVVIVPLAGVAEPGQVPAAVARAVGVRETGAPRSRAAWARPCARCVCCWSWTTSSTWRRRPRWCWTCWRPGRA